MGFNKEYDNKKICAKEAVKVIRSGDWIDYGWSVGTPVSLDKALANRIEDLYDLNLRGGVLIREPEIFQVRNPEEHFSWNSWHTSGIERKAIDKGFHPDFREGLIEEAEKMKIWRKSNKRG